MHSLGHQTLEATGALATPATLLPRLVAELDNIVLQLSDADRPDLTVADLDRLAVVLEAAKQALLHCNGCDQYVPVFNQADRVIPSHKDKRDRLCSYAGAYITPAQLAKLQGHRLPALV